LSGKTDTRLGAKQEGDHQPGFAGRSECPWERISSGRGSRRSNRDQAGRREKAAPNAAWGGKGNASSGKKRKKSAHRLPREGKRISRDKILGTGKRGAGGTFLGREKEIARRLPVRREIGKRERRRRRTTKKARLMVIFPRKKGGDDYYPARKIGR